MGRRAAAAGIALVIGALASNHATAQEPSPPANAPAAAKRPPQDEAVTRLLKVQLKAAQQAYRAALDTLAVQQLGGLLVQVMGDTTARPDLAYTWSVRWLQAQRDLSTTPEQRTAAFAEHQQRMKQLRETIRLLVGNGTGGILRASEVPAAEWYLTEAELWLLKERAK